MDSVATARRKQLAHRVVGDPQRCPFSTAVDNSLCSILIADLRNIESVCVAKRKGPSDRLWAQMLVSSSNVLSGIPQWVKQLETEHSQSEL